jgi:predicted dehydrogenase
MKIKVSFVGAGTIIREHIKAFSAIKNVELAGLYSRTLDKAKRLSHEFKIKHICSSIEDLFSKTKSDLVVIGVPIESTKKVCLESIKFPWKCLVEKPLGLNLKETIEIKRNSNSNKIYLALNRNYLNSTLQVKKLLENDCSKRIVFLFDQENTVEAKLYHSKKVIDNYMFANSIHIIDYCRIFARGKIKNIRSIFDLKKNNIRIFSKKIIFSSGDIVLYSTAWNRPGPWSVDISTDKYFFNIKPLEKVYIRSFNKNQDFQLTSDNDDKKYKPGFKKQALEMIKLINKKKNTVPNINDVLYTAKLIQRLYNN